MFLISELGAIPLAYAASAAPFSPQAIFALPDHKMIDDACPDARKFADAAAADSASIGARQAVDGANALLACFRIRRLNPDPQAQRYLALAAGAALYLAGTETTGDTAMHLFKAADSLAEQLGAPSPDRSTVIDKVEVGSGGRSTASDDQQAINAQDAHLVAHSGPAHTTYVIRRDPLGGSHPLVFGDYATSMRVDIERQMTTIAADERTRRQGSEAASPAPAPTKTP